MPKKKDGENAVPKPAEAAAETEKKENSPPAEAPSPAAELESQLAAEKERYLRLAAEYDNYRKRCARERDSLYNDVRSDTISKLLPVYDNLERALKQNTEDAAFYKGVEMTMTQLKEIFTGLGIEEIPALGQAFDPSIHNAVMHVEDESAGESIVVEEFQKGFKLGDKIIRFSMVKVAN